MDHSLRFSPGFYRDGSEYTEDEKEFIMAVEEWRKRYRCRFPTSTNLLAIAKSLGYRKMDETEDGST